MLKKSSWKIQNIISNTISLGIQNKMNRLIESLNKSPKLSKEQTKQLKRENGIFPKIYYLPKMHKNPNTTY